MSMNDKKNVQLPPDRYLNDEEHTAYMEDFTGVVNGVIEKVISIADKHNIDRDNAIQHFATIFKVMTEISTFQNWVGVNPFSSMTKSASARTAMAGTADSLERRWVNGSGKEF